MIFQIARRVQSWTPSIPPSNSTGWDLFLQDLCSWPKEYSWWFYRKVLVAFGVCIVCLFINSHIKLLLVAGCNNLWEKQESHILIDESRLSQNVFVMYKYFLWYFEIGIVCCGAITQNDAAVIYWQNRVIVLWKLCFLFILIYQLIWF